MYAFLLGINNELSLREKQLWHYIYWAPTYSMKIHVLVINDELIDRKIINRMSSRWSKCHLVEAIFNEF